MNKNRISADARKYIVKCYSHGEKAPGKGGLRRVFRWPAGPGRQPHEGTVDDFAAHLETRFQRTFSIGTIHAILRRAGHALFEAPHPTNPDRPIRGKVVPREPEGPPMGNTADPLPEPPSRLHMRHQVQADVCMQDMSRLLKEAADAFLRVAVVFEGLNMRAQALGATLGGEGA